MLEAVERTVSRSFLCLWFVVLSWRIGRVNSIGQLPKWLGAARRRFDSQPLSLLPFLLFILSSFFSFENAQLILFNIKRLISSTYTDGVEARSHKPALNPALL